MKVLSHFSQISKSIFYIIFLFTLQSYLTFSQSVIISPTDDFGILSKNSSTLISNPGAIPIGVNGSGTRLMWIANKSAFRVGTVTGTQWDYDSIGPWSFAAGFDTKASEENSISLGYKTEASGFASVALGYGTKASGSFSTAIGQSSIASSNSVSIGYQTNSGGFYSVALGNSTGAFGNNSTALGYGGIAYGNSSIAMGYSTVSSGSYSSAIGYSTNAQGESSFAAGYLSEAIGTTSTTFGKYNYARGDYSTSLGFSTYAQSYASLVIGRHNLISGNISSWDSNDPVFVIGNGTSNSSRSNALIVYKNGNATLSGTLTQLSDINLKSKITKIKFDKNTILGISGYNYYLEGNNFDNFTMQTGLIAQEVQKLFPELVRKESNGYLSVNYLGFIPHLIEAYKLQQKELDYLKERLEQIEKMLKK